MGATRWPSNRDAEADARLLALLDALGTDGQLVHAEHLPARDAVPGQPQRPVADEVLTALGLPGLWSHQAEAIDLVRAGRSVAVATGTASGKSVCYQVPIAEAVLADTAATALLLFPTKALAQDQARALTALGVPGLLAATYDGDTTPEARAVIRRRANVVLTNPEMLHAGILPSHGRWATFLKHLRYVVVDELHVLRGVFGTHVAHILRRLRRLCRLYGSDPVFVFCSATIGRPAELASELCGLPVVPVLTDGSPRGRRIVALWNPPLLDADTGVRASTSREVSALVTALVTAGRRTLAFTRSRRAAEVVATDVRRRLTDLGRSEDVQPYRAGYLPAERRAIEDALFSGRLAAVVATSALELGIDVGGLDACVLHGFPGTIASMWQQMGRAGRHGQDAVAVLVAGTDQLDQWLMAHPSEVFRRPPEPAVVNLANPFVLQPHLASAAFEHPLRPADEAYWGDDLAEGVRLLVLDDVLRVRDGRAYWAGRGSPAPGVGLRSGTSHEYLIVDEDDQVIGTVDASRAFETVHPGALYLHLGQQYRVRRLDIDDRVATVVADDADERTQARSTTDITFVAPERAASVGRAGLALGAVAVESHVIGYERRDLRSGEVVAREPLDLPPATLHTRAVWYTFDDALLDEADIAADRVPGTLHALEHAAIGILPLFTICDRWDVGGVSTARHAGTGLPTVVIYDGYPGGAGVAELGFEAADRHLAATLELLERCACQSGCPSCVQSPKCGNGNEPLDKAGAIALLKVVLRAP